LRHIVCHFRLLRRPIVQTCPPANANSDQLLAVVTTVLDEQLRITPLLPNQVVVVGEMRRGLRAALAASAMR